MNVYMERTIVLPSMSLCACDGSYNNDNRTIKALRKSSKLKAVQKMFENWSISNDEIKTITFDEFIEMESNKRTFENVASLNQEVIELLFVKYNHTIYSLLGLF